MLRLAIPAYGHPALDDMWRRIPALPAGTTVVLDPASGPGEAPEEIYVVAVARARRAGIRVHGYVDTLYGMHGPETVDPQVARYVEWYRVDGVFLDRTAPSGPGVDDALAIAAALRAAGLEVSMNPGQPQIDPRYASVDALVANFEGPLEGYREASFPDWATGPRTARLWHLVYDAPDAGALTEALALTTARGADAVYVTDRSLPNPWDRLPPYFADELSALAVPDPPASG